MKPPEGGARRRRHAAWLEVRDMIRRFITALAIVVSTILLVGVSWGWVAGSYSHDPLEVKRVANDYSPASGGNYRSVHLGVHSGGVYFSADEVAPILRRDPFLVPDFRRLAGTREWQIGRADYAGAQALYFTFPDTRCAPPQKGDLLGPDWRQLGFRAFRFSSFGKVGFAVVVPCWFLAALAAPAPTMWLRRLLRRRRRRTHGCCVNCGYDLRGSPGRCPECGEG